MSGETSLLSAPKREIARRDSAAKSSKVTAGKAGAEKISTPPESPVPASKSTGAEKISTPSGKAIVHIPPGELQVHPDLADVPAPSASEDAELEDSISELGILHPLIADSPDRRQVLDGARRLGKALKLNLPTVPVIFDDRSDALTVAISTALTRRHWSKGQRALYLFKLHRDLRKGRLDSVPDMGLRAGAGGNPDAEEQNTRYGHVSFRELERRYGLCNSLFVRLSKMWNNSTKEEWEAIVNGIESGEKENSLDTQYTGFVGRIATKGVGRPEETVANHSIRMRRGIVAFGQEAKHWKHFDTKKRGELTQKIDDAFGKLDADLLAEVIRIATEKRAAKEAVRS